MISSWRTSLSMRYGRDERNIPRVEPLGPTHFNTEAILHVSEIASDPEEWFR